MPEAPSVVHVVNTSNFAGVERHVVTLANQQAADGLTVGVIGGRKDVMRTELSPQVTHLEYRHLAATIGSLRGGRADIVHAHMTSAETAALFTQGAGLVTTRHFAARRGKSRLGRAVSPLIRQRFPMQIAVSRFVQESIDGDSVVVHNGVAEAPLSSRSSRTILVAQRLAAEKATSVAIDIFEQSGLAKTGWTLLIAGEGPCHRSLGERARSVPGVALLGFRSDIPLLMKEASIFLAPAPAEPFGLSVVEAMAHGIPVLAADGGGHAETVGLSGPKFLFPPADSRAGARLLRQLGDDQTQATHYGRRLRDIQRTHFTPRVQADQTRRVYEEVLHA